MPIEPQRYRLALVLKSLFFPLTYPEITTSLEELGYTITLPKQLPMAPGARAYVGGRIANKEGCFVDIDPNSKIVASEGIDIYKVIGAFEELQVMITNDFGVDLNNEIVFVELTADVSVIDGTNPLQSFQALFKDFAPLVDFSDILKREVSPFGLRLAPKDVPSTAIDWFEIRIEPRVTQPSKAYYVGVVYRKEDAGEVISFTRKLNETIGHLFKILEGV